MFVYIAVLFQKPIISSSNSVTDLCPTCNEQPETVLHCLVTCEFAKACHLKLGLTDVHGSFQSFLEWIQLVFQQRNKAQIHQIVTVCWMVWKSRNDLVWNQRSMDANEVVESAFVVLNHWESAQDTSFNQFMCHMTQDDGHERWNLPLSNRIKINTDAATFEESSRFSYAMVVRNNTSEFVEARSRCTQGRVAPELAEATGIREALSWIKQKRVSGVELETDCLQIVLAIRSSVPCYSYLGRVVEECRTLLASLKDQNVLFRFIKRSANKHCSSLPCEI